MRASEPSTRQYTDAETGFQYLRARYYDPATGNFLTRDPLEATTGDAYGYADNNPLNRVDLTGMQATPPTRGQALRCLWLQSKITNLRNSLSRQKQNFHLNKNRWSPCHPEAIKHRETFRKQQADLRKRLREWNDKYCDDSGIGGLPADARAFAAMKVPAPNQNPPPLRYSSPGLLPRLGNWIDGILSGSHGEPNYTK